MKIAGAVYISAALLLLPIPTAAQSSGPRQVAQDHWSVDFLDRSVEPCVDFYHFACGGWQKQNPLPPDRSYWQTYEKIGERNLTIVREILDKASSESPHRSALETRAGDFYYACINTSAIESSGIDPLRAELERIDRLSTTTELPSAIAHMHLLGIRALSQVYTPGRAKVLFDFRADPDDKNATEIVPVIDAAGIGLPDRDYYTREDADARQTREKYLQHIEKMFTLLGESSEQALQDAKAVFAIEADLAEHSLGPAERRDPSKTYHLLTFTELKRRTPAFSWQDYLKLIGLNTIKVVNVSEPDFLVGMNHAVESHSAAEWRAYLRWHLIHYSAYMLPEQFSAATFDFFGRTLTGAKELPPRWNTCVNATEAALGEIVGELFIERTFSPGTKQKIATLIEEIRGVLSKDIEATEWMGPQTKREALRKLQKTLIRVVAPENARRYPFVKSDRHDPLKNLFSGGEDEFRWALSRIGEPAATKKEWRMLATRTDAYNDPQTNSVTFPAGILQPPVFDPSLDDAMNFGSMASLVAHEFTHALDDRGRQYDADGNRIDWWTKADAENFNARAQCFVTEYDMFVAVRGPGPPSDGIHINGNLTLGENIADNGGARVALTAMEEARKTNQNASRIDDFTPEQRFFLGYATLFCANTSTEFAAMHARSNEHSLWEFRVNGVVQNLPEFGHAFGCRKGQPMVSAHMCRLW